MNGILQAIQQYTNPKLLSPVDETNTLNTPAKRYYVDQNSRSPQDFVTPGTPATPTPTHAVLAAIDAKQNSEPSWIPDAQGRVQGVINSGKHAVLSGIEQAKKSIAAGAQELPSPTPAPDASDFEKIAIPILNKYGIPPSVGLGIAAAEGGRIGSNNVFNLNATDSNPQGASSYNDQASGIEAFAKLIASNPRYAKAYANRIDPAKMLTEIQNAGYAGDPKDWQKRKLKETADFPYKQYSQFVMDTPAYKRYAK